MRDQIAVRSARQRAIEREIKRLERRLVPLRILSNQVSWLRVGTFFAGLGAAVSIGAQVNALAGWSVFAVAAMIFLAVVLYHQRLERWVDTFTTSRAIRSDQLARMTHDWEHMANLTFAHARAKTLALDLDLTGPRSLHHLLDTTLSRQASQLLADWLTQDHPALEQVHARQSIVRELVSFARLRERFGLTFRLVLREPLEGEKLVQWLSVAFDAHRLKWALPAATGLVALNFILVALNLWAGFPAYWIFSLLFYLAFYIFNQAWLTTIFGALSRMSAELDRFSVILNFLENVPLGSREHLARLCAPLCDAAHPPSAYTRKLRLVAVGVGLRMNPVFGLALNLIAPWDFFFAYLTVRSRAQVVELFPTWMRVCYELDAYMALANFAYLNPAYTFPDITRDAQPILAVQNLGHPLIPHAQSVRNDFLFDALGELAIITGSNMAGKSTFLKSVGINLCLAYAGAPVVATHFRAFPFRLATCIHITDSITDGFSYFYAEVKCLKRLLEELKTRDDSPLLYLIDEIFRGTNNRERFLGSRAYIQALLGENGVGLLATHDLELAGLAEQRPQVRNYHFRDEVADGKLVFDYKIRRGPCPTTNALKIMRMEGLPIPTGS
ncbi:MAG: hypothetical protein HY868_20915 [Chloroflexi bacterium]|nr:hypothetical protein [Chloroflexota bacterium]